MEQKDEPKQKLPDTRTRILLAARDIFTEEGYDRATTRRIAQEANVNEVTLYRHFGNKENLFISVVNEFSAVFKLSEMKAINLRGEPYEDLVILGTLLYESLTERHKEVLTLLCESNRNEFIKDVMVKIPQQLQGVYASFFSQHIKAGNFVEDDPNVLATAFMGMFFSLTIFKNFLGGEVSHDLNDISIVEKYVRIFLKGIQNQ